MLLKNPGVLFKKHRQVTIVLIEDGDQLTVRRRDAPIDGSGRTAAVFRQSNQANVRGVLSDEPGYHGRCIVGRVVIDNQDFLRL